ncbi:MAG: NmrA family NAD(P)-binding protein [Verrucomicrobia bacterium]|nr:NmrA family NAD(P)-binding protein [Verrucomicrobiota bacterium]
MSHPLVLVTGAAGGMQGQTGRHVTRLLLEREVPIRAFVHTIDERSHHLSALGAEVVEGDFLDFHSVERAMRGVSAVYFAYPVQAGLLEATTIMADVARKAGVIRLVNMGMLRSSPDAPTPRMRQNYFSEQIFEWVGIGAVHVRAAVFYENVRALTASSLARDGTVLLPLGPDSTVIPLVAGEDVARVVVGILTGSSVLPGTSYPVIGEVLAVRDIVATFSQVLSREVHYREIPDELWYNEALQRGFNQHAAEHLSHLWRSLRTIAPASASWKPSSTIETLGGRKPKAFVEFVREQKNSWMAELAH